MKLIKQLLSVALTIVSVATLQAQTYNGTMRLNSWTLYGAIGISGYNGLRSNTITDIHKIAAPYYAVGTKYYIHPWMRVGANISYNKLKVLNNDITSTQTIQNGYNVGNYADGILTIDKSILIDRHDQHMLALDINADFNIFKLCHNSNLPWNLWIGTGVGYLHGWDHTTLTTAIHEEAIAKGEGHFNVYNHDYIITESSNRHTNTLYLPINLSLEYDITPRWTAGIKGEYKFMPLNKQFTPKGLWNVCAVISYNLTNRANSKERSAERHNEQIAHFNEDINELRKRNAHIKQQKMFVKYHVVSEATFIPQILNKM